MPRHKSPEIKERLLNNYYDTFSHHGFGVGVRKLSEEVAASTYVMTYHFNSKNELIEQVMKRVVDRAATPFFDVRIVPDECTVFAISRQLTERLVDNNEPGGHRILAMKQHIGSFALTEQGSKLKAPEHLRLINSGQMSCLFNLIGLARPDIPISWADNMARDAIAIADSVALSQITQ